MKKEKRIDENLYNEKSLYLLNIKELRDLGRKIGVPAPATLKKQDLVDYILKIVYGEIDAPKRSSYGRPNVREVDMGQYLAKIKNKTDVYDEVLGASFGDFESIFKVASPDESIKTNEIVQRIFVEENNKFYLRVYGFVESEGDIEISEEIKKKFNLENFDIIEVILSGKSFKIVSINGKVVNQKNTLENENLGKQQVFHYSTKEEISKEILNFLKENKDLKTIVLSREDYSSNCDTMVKIDETQDHCLNYKQFMSFVTLCEKFVFEGETFAIVTDESDFIEKTIESLDEEVSNRTKNISLRKLKNLFRLEMLC